MKNTVVGGVLIALLVIGVILTFGWQEKNKESSQQQDLVQTVKALKTKVSDLEQRVSDLEEAILLSLEVNDDDMMLLDENK